MTIQAQLKPLIIIGFSGFGKEVYWLAERLGISVEGFLDDAPSLAGKVFRDATVVGNSSQWTEYAHCRFVIAIGNPRIRKQVHASMTKLGQPEFATLIDPGAIVMREHIEIGEGSIICAGTVATTAITIGKHCIINLHCTVGHDVVMADFCTVAPLVAISGNVQLEELVEVGTSASIRQGIRMERGSMLGMGGVLTKVAASNTVLVGNPAKPLRTLEDSNA